MSDVMVRNMETAANMQVISSTMMYSNTMKFDNSVGFLNASISKIMISNIGFVGTITLLTEGFMHLTGVLQLISREMFSIKSGDLIKEYVDIGNALLNFRGESLAADLDITGKNFEKSLLDIKSANSPQSSGGLPSIGPMMKLYFLIKPLMELIKGLMEPLDPLMDIIGALGSILGLLLVPIIEPIVGLLIPMIPILIAGISVVTPMLKLLFLPITYLGAVLTLTTPYLEKILGVIGWLTSWVGALVDWIKKAMYSIANGFNKLTNVFGWFKWNKAVIDW